MPQRVRRHWRFLRKASGTCAWPQRWVCQGTRCATGTAPMLAGNSRSKSPTINGTTRRTPRRKRCGSRPMECRGPNSNDARASPEEAVNIGCDRRRRTIEPTRMLPFRSHQTLPRSAHIFPDQNHPPLTSLPTSTLTNRFPKTPSGSGENPSRTNGLTPVLLKNRLSSNPAARSPIRPREAQHTKNAA